MSRQSSTEDLQDAITNQPSVSLEKSRSPTPTAEEIEANQLAEAARKAAEEAMKRVADIKAKVTADREAARKAKEEADRKATAEAAARAGLFKQQQQEAERKAAEEVARLAKIKAEAVKTTQSCACSAM